MARDIFINGETLVMVQGSVSNSLLATPQQLGLASAPIRITPTYNHDPVNADAWGRAPFEMQFMLSTVGITMTLVHFDRSVLSACLCESMGGAASEGQLTRAGTRLGSNQALYSAGCHYITLFLTSPQAGQPWKFYTTFMTGPPMEFPLGTERSLVVVNWVAIPAASDPYGGGTGAQNAYIFDHTS